LQLEDPVHAFFRGGKAGYENTYNGAFKGRLNVGAETRGDDDIEKSLQKIITDGWIGRFILNALATKSS